MGVGDGCLLCGVNPRRWNDPEALAEDWPYPLDRDLDSLKEVETRVTTDKDGKYVRGGRNDWATRQGCSKPPICLRELHPFTVTHKVHIKCWSKGQKRA